MWKMIKGKQCEKTRHPGVWRLKDGRYWIRARAKSPKTGKLVEVNRDVEAKTAAEASALLQEALRTIRQDGNTPQRPWPRFSDYAVSLMERKIAQGRLTGRNSTAHWNQALRKHLLPFFGDMFINQIRRTDIEAFKSQLAQTCRSPHSANGWLRILRTIVRAFVGEYEMATDPIKNFEFLDTSMWRTYTREQPNSLEPAEISALLELAFEHRPQHYALLVVGFVLGQRPSSLTPLRRQGPEADIKWDTGLILFRRSHTRGRDVVERTKTRQDLEVDAGPDSLLFEVLAWHVSRLKDAQLESDLLFPAHDGGLIAKTTIARTLTHLNLLLACRTLAPEQAAELDRRSRGGPENRPLPRCFKAALVWAQAQGWPLGLTKWISPKAMRRSFYLSCDRAKIADRAARLVSGHTSEAMANRYRTPGAQGEGQRGVVGQVIDLAGVRRQMERAKQARELAPPGAPLHPTKTAQRGTP